MSSVQAAPVALAIHGGAGTLTREAMTPALEAEYRAALQQALNQGYALLQKGGSSVDAVEAAVRVLEDSPLFNAGRGAVFTHDGINELDASIMSSHEARAGAVAVLHRVKNPVSLARAVMEHSPHVMLIGDGAEKFAQEQHLELVDPAYFRTDFRWQQWQDALKNDGLTLSEDHRGMAQHAAELLKANANKFGTVGAVALDKNGELAAATSTGGMTNKRWGRVGDTPVIGAGTYANAKCAVSATGHGEFFIRAAVAHDICARVEYLKQDIARAAGDVVKDKLVKMGGEGGVIVINAAGEVSMPFNTSGMYRAAIDAKGNKTVAIFAE